MFTSQVDLAALKAELATYMTDTDQRLSDRAYAAHLLAYVNFFSPLQLELASMVDAFYLQEVYPNRKELSGRLFAELSI
ncbi:hypothetical protein MXD81_17640, partial [Microbacteriaceae bacterium K1510]|nr:hypothetical protein [Microbacteriaceae bacterium K1510]